MQLCLFEDQHFNNFLPLVYFRPIYALRCGSTKLHEKIERVFPKASITYHCRPELASYLRETHPRRMVNQFEEQPTWFVNGRVLADSNFQNLVRSTPKHDRVYYKEGVVVAAFVSGEFIRSMREKISARVVSKEIFSEIPGEEVEAVLFNYPWELVHRNGEEMRNDYQYLAKKLKKEKNLGKVYPGSHLLNKKDILIGTGTIVKPGAVLDAEKGPIILGKNVVVYPNAVIEGPAYIGDGSLIKAGAKIYVNTSIGEVCKVGGEVEASIIHSYSNKQHDGFLGHSYIGSWVNIGADTNNSDLKNNYGTVDVMINGERIDTGLQFVGLFMGDHSKTGINVMFDTGAVVGVSCNIYGAGLPPKYLPSFSWGNVASSFSTYRLDKSIETAKHVMARRNVQWSTPYEQLFRWVFEATTAERARARIF